MGLEESLMRARNLGHYLIGKGGDGKTRVMTTALTS